MEAWLAAGLDYATRWLEFQLRYHQQPGCALAVTHKGELVFEQALGQANLSSGAALTPRHRFRVASQSKSFAATAILLLRERGALRLDDPVGDYVKGLHPEIAARTIAQLLSHCAGLVRDGSDSGQFLDLRPYLSAEELLDDLAVAPTLEAGLRFKYSNHGYGLLGLAIEAVTGEPYADWIAREIIAPLELTETVPDIALAADAPMASGHSGRQPLGRRVVVPGDNPTNALTPAAGIVSTAADMARFYAQLSPKAEKSLLSVASRREMLRRQWRDPDSSLEVHYGLGIMSGAPGDWEWFGHSGGFQGFITFSAVLPEQELSLSILSNAVDGLANHWFGGLHNILKTMTKAGAPTERVSGWRGRWWNLWGTLDLVPCGDAVTAAVPAMLNPFADAQELEILGPDQGRVSCGSGFYRYGEPVRLDRDDTGRPRALWVGGIRMVPEAELVREMEERYGDA